MSKVHRGSGWCWDLVQHLLQTWLFKPFEAYLLWKGLFATVEILPQLKTYLDENNNEIGNGFKLYTSYHLGYHFPLFNNRMYIEPQIHCNYWPIDTNTPPGIQEIEKGWNNYFLFEPNIYIGINF